MLGLIGSGLTVGIAGCSAFSKNGGSPATSGGRNGGEQTTTETIQSPTTTTTDTKDGTTSASDSLQPKDIEPAPKAYRSVPLPSKPGKHKYATMGSEDASVTARFYGAWKCPYTRHFVLEFLPTLIEEYVNPGDVAIEFRAVAYEGGEGFHGPDSPRAARAGLVIWNQQPEHFWTYFGTIFKNQNSAPGWATTKTLLSMAEKSDVSDLSTIASLIQSGKYQSQVEGTMDQVHKIPISRVPRIVVGDSVTAPTVNPKKTKAQLDAALGRGPWPKDTVGNSTVDGSKDSSKPINSSNNSTAGSGPKNSPNNSTAGTTTTNTTTTGTNSTSTTGTNSTTTTSTTNSTSSSTTTKSGN